MEVPPRKLRAQEEAFECPPWVGRPRPGVRFDVLKNGRVVETMRLDVQPFYLFGRSKAQCDFLLDNPSVSRAHFVLVHHRNGSCFIIDLGSHQGTSVDNVPCGKGTTKVLVGQDVRAGNSTRVFRLQDRQSSVPDPLVPQIHGKWDQPSLPEDSLKKRRGKGADSGSEEYDPEQALIDDAADDVRFNSRPQPPSRGLALGLRDPRAADDEARAGPRPKRRHASPEPPPKLMEDLRGNGERRRRGGDGTRDGRDMGRDGRDGRDDPRLQKRRRQPADRPRQDSGAEDSDLYENALPSPARDGHHRHHRRKDRQRDAQRRDASPAASEDPPKRRPPEEEPSKKKRKALKEEAHHRSDSEVEAPKFRRSRYDEGPGPQARPTPPSKPQPKPQPEAKAGRPRKPAKAPRREERAAPEKGHRRPARLPAATGPASRSPSPAAAAEEDEAEAPSSPPIAAQPALVDEAAEAKAREAKEQQEKAKEKQEKVLRDMFEKEKELAEVMANYVTNFVPDTGPSGGGTAAGPQPVPWQCRACAVDRFAHRAELYAHLRSDPHRERWSSQQEARQAQGQSGGAVQECVVCDAKVPDKLLELHLVKGHNLDMTEVADVSVCYLTTDLNDFDATLASALKVKPPRVMTAEAHKAKVVAALKKRRSEKLHRQKSEAEKAKREEKWRALKWLSFAKAYCYPLFKANRVTREQFKEILSQAMRTSFDTNPAPLLNAVSLKKALDELCQPYAPDEAERAEQMEAFKRELALVGS